MNEGKTPAGEYFVEVVVPLRLAWNPVYRSSSRLSRGDCVSVVFSGKKYFAVVLSTDVTPNIEREFILDVLEESPLPTKISDKELQLWEFLSNYYLCSLGEVFKAARPLLLLKAEVSLLLKAQKLKERISLTEEKLGRKHHSAKVVEKLQVQLESLKRELSLFSAPAPIKPVKATAAPKPLLLWSSKRYERYASAVQEALSRGGQALLLAPDTASCRRLGRSLRPLLGDKLELFTPETTPTQRARIAAMLRQNRSIAVIGTKAAVFLPFGDTLSLVVVDEEQDSLYKQHDSAPRYNGRDVAVTLAGFHNAAVILGSACPSLESLYNSSLGKYSLEKEDRASTSGELKVIDVKAEMRKNGMKGSFSLKLIGEIAQSSGNIILIRGWEDRNTVESEAAELFSSQKDIKIMTLRDFRSWEEETALVAVLQADALVGADDFRSDEKALQIVEHLKERAQNVVIQTSVPSRFDGGRTLYSLLSERRQFNFPPYTRLVEVKREGSDKVLARHFLERNKDLPKRKAELREALANGVYLDVDPL